MPDFGTYRCETVFIIIRLRMLSKKVLFASRSGGAGSTVQGEFLTLVQLELETAWTCAILGQHERFGGGCA